MRELRLDDKLLLISLLFLALSVLSIGLSFGEIIQVDIGYIAFPLFLIYLVAFTLFLYYNHELSKEEYEEKSRFDVQNPYKISFYFGIFLFFFGIIGGIIEFNYLLVALTWGGIFAMVYSIAGWYDLRNKVTN